jgi:hypothetical protein
VQHVAGSLGLGRVAARFGPFLVPVQRFDRRIDIQNPRVRQFEPRNPTPLQ